MPSSKNKNKDKKNGVPKEPEVATEAVEAAASVEPQAAAKNEPTDNK